MSVGEDHELVRVGRRLGVCEPAAEDRLAPERAEERWRDRERPELLRLAASDETDRTSGEQRRVLDRGGLRAAIDVVGNRHAGLREPHQRIRVPDEHQPIGVGVRQRLEQGLVNEAEDGGVRANPERQRQDGDDGEDGLLPERPKRVADVLHGCLDGAARQTVWAVRMHWPYPPRIHRGAMRRTSRSVAT